MSYLRGRFYVYGDGERIHLWVRDKADDVTELVHDCEFAAGVAIPTRIFDMLALEHVKRLEKSGELADARTRYTAWQETGILPEPPLDEVQRLSE